MSYIADNGVFRFLFSFTNIIFHIYEAYINICYKIKNYFMAKFIYFTKKQKTRRLIVNANRMIDMRNYDFLNIDKTVFVNYEIFFNIMNKFNLNHNLFKNNNNIVVFDISVIAQFCRDDRYTDFLFYYHRSVYVKNGIIYMQITPGLITYDMLHIIGDLTNISNRNDDEQCINQMHNTGFTCTCYECDIQRKSIAPKFICVCPICTHKTNNQVIVQIYIKEKKYIDMIMNYFSQSVSFNNEITIKFITYINNILVVIPKKVKYEPLRHLWIAGNYSTTAFIHKNA